MMETISTSTICGYHAAADKVCIIIVLLSLRDLLMLDTDVGDCCDDRDNDDDEL